MFCISFLLLLMLIRLFLSIKPLNYSVHLPFPLLFLFSKGLNFIWYLCHVMFTSIFKLCAAYSLNYFSLLVYIHIIFHYLSHTCSLSIVCPCIIMLPRYLIDVFLFMNWCLLTICVISSNPEDLFWASVQTVLRIYSKVISGTLYGTAVIKRWRKITKFSIVI